MQDVSGLVSITLKNKQDLVRLSCILNTEITFLGLILQGPLYNVTPNVSDLYLMRFTGM